MDDATAPPSLLDQDEEAEKHARDGLQPRTAGKRTLRSVPDGVPLNNERLVMSFWDFFWLLICTYIFVAYLMVLFQIIADVFRDRELGGFAKALWMIALIVVPVITALIYLIARGRRMAERQAGAARRAQAETEEYIKSVSGAPSSANQIASAKALLDDGTIDQTEYEQLKVKALA
jgi:signal transduction histidine kinase